MIRSLAGMIGIFLLAACGSSPSVAQGLASQGYLASSSTQVAFIQLTVSGNSLSGTFDVAQLTGTSVKTEHETISGSESGQSVTLTFSAGLGVTVNVSGAINGDALVLNIPQSDGQIASTTFTPSTTAAYNSALQQLQGDAGNAQATAASQAHQASLDSAVASAAQQVNGDIGRLQNDSFGGTSIASDLQGQQKDLAGMRADEAHARTDDQLSQCADAGGVVADAGGITADAGGIQADQGGVTTTATGLQSDISAANSDFAKLQQEEQADPAYSGSVPTKQQVSAAIAPIQSAINSNVAAANTAVAQANSVAASATAEADAFQKQYCG